MSNALMRNAQKEILKDIIKNTKREKDNLNGADDVFDIPKDSDIVIDSERETVSEAVKKIITYLEEH